MASAPSRPAPSALDRILPLWKRKLGAIRASDAAYLRFLYRQYQDPPTAAQQLKIGSGFFPSALLDEKGRRDLLGAVEYSELLGRRQLYASWARKAVLVLDPMNGGTGTSVQREAYLRSLGREERDGKPVLGAKGSDLFFEVRISGRPARVSVSEAKILKVLNQSGCYRRIHLQQLASTETLRSIEELLGSVNLYGRLGLRSPWKRKTYRQILAAHPRLRLMPVLIQAALPTVDEEGGLTTEYMAPGGHGQWGVYLLSQAMDWRPKRLQGAWIHAIYNEDGINNLVDPVIVGWMAKEGVPAAMISTSKTGIDKKGGQIGIVRREDGRVCKDMLEEAQAESAGQADLFHEMGLSRGRKGKQFFNTNTALFNFSVLAPFLKELSGLLGRGNLVEIVSPRLIQNRKTKAVRGKPRSFVQLEGALGSCLLNLDGYLATTRNERVRDLLRRHGFLGRDGRVRFLRFVNVDARLRTRFFTPIKNAFDFWLQCYSDLYRLNTKTWELECLKPGSIPAVKLSPAYADVTRVIDCFGGAGGVPAASLAGLKTLEVDGPVLLAGVVLKGSVRITSALARAASLEALGGSNHFPRRGSRIVLDDVEVRIARAGRPSVRRLA